MPFHYPSKPSANTNNLVEVLKAAFPVFSVLQSILTGSSTGLAGISATLADLINLRWLQLDSHESRLAEVDEAIANLEEIAPAIPVTPAYVSDLEDMPTCQRSDLIGFDGDGNVYMPRYTPDRYANVLGVVASAVDYTPIVVDRRGIVDKIRWIGGSDSSIFGLNQYYVALCVYNPDTENIEKVWDSGNIRDTYANVSGGGREIEIPMGIEQECTPGQILFFAHQQISPGLAQANRSVACKLQAGIGRPPTLLLDACYYRSPDRYESIPSSIPFASLTRLNDRIPWAAVSVTGVTA